MLRGLEIEWCSRRVSWAVVLVVACCASREKGCVVRVFPVALPSGERYWTVLDEQLAVVGVADAFLRHVRFGRDQVSAGGGQCPLRFRCLGCEHFSTDVSYLPELRSYLDDLLRTRERLQAMITADDWAKREAMPSEEEIARLRRLIRRVSEDLGSLTPQEQAEIHDAVTAVRKTRQAFLGIPRVRQPLPDVRPERPA
jgi:hypothetical protein